MLVNRTRPDGRIPALEWDFSKMQICSVPTRAVTLGSDGSGEPNSSFNRSDNREDEIAIAHFEFCEVVLLVRVIAGIRAYGHASGPVGPT